MTVLLLNKLDNLYRKIILSIISICALLCSFSHPVYAFEENISRNMVGVSFTPPENEEPGNSIQGTSKPTQVWYVNIDGKYDFSGWSYYQPLYTNYKFTGKTTYSLFVKNESTSNTLKVYAQNATQTFAQTQIAANSSSWITFSGMNTSTRFEGISGGYYSFSGYIN